MKKIIHLVSFALAVGVIATGIVTAASTNKQLQVSGPVETTQTHAGTESKAG